MRAKILFPTARRAGLALGLGALLLPLPGCQSITGVSPASQVRIIDAVPNGGGIDVYQGSGILAYNLGLGVITSYVPITPGNYAINVDAAGTKTLLVSATGTFANGQQYTVVVGNYFSQLQEIILKDQSQPAPTGQVAIRVVDQSTRGGTVDLYLVPTGSTIAQVRPFLTGIAFGSNTGYVDVPSGSYTLEAVPSGTVPTATTTTLYTGSSLNYSSGSAKTVVLIDQQLVTVPGIQAIVADDYESPAATS